MDTFKKVVYDDHKRILDLIADDLYGDSEQDKKEFLDKYLKKNYSYLEDIIRYLRFINNKIDYRIKNISTNDLYDIQIIM